MHSPGARFLEVADLKLADDFVTAPRWTRSRQESFVRLSQVSVAVEVEKKNVVNRRLRPTLIEHGPHASFAGITKKKKPVKRVGCGQLWKLRRFAPHPGQVYHLALLRERPAANQNNDDKRSPHIGR